MEIYLPDELIERAREYLKRLGWCLPIDIFIEEAVDSHIESWPWGLGDICVHCEECMHRKSVEDWKKEE